MLRRHPILSLATFGYLAVVGWITLGPQPLDSAGRGQLWRIIGFLQRQELTSWITYDGIEFAANILMFIPIGLMFVLLLGRRRWWLAIALSVIMTFGIEGVQHFLADRVSDPRDLLANSIGGVIGVFVALILTWPKAHQLRREARQRGAARVPELV